MGSSTQGMQRQAPKREIYGNLPFYGKAVADTHNWGFYFANVFNRLDMYVQDSPCSLRCFTSP
jgi:hypothetical protein